MEELVKSAASIVVEYLISEAKSYSRSSGQAVGAGVAQRAKAVYQMVKSRLSGKKGAPTTFEHLEADPYSVTSRSELEKLLAEAIKSDPSFATTLREMVSS